MSRVITKEDQEKLLQAINEIDSLVNEIEEANRGHNAKPKQPNLRLWQPLYRDILALQQKIYHQWCLAGGEHRGPNERPPWEY